MANIKSDYGEGYDMLRLLSPHLDDKEEEEVMRRYVMLLSDILF